LDRQQAMTLLKQLTVSKLIDPSWISMEYTSNGFKLKIRAVQKTPELIQFFATNNLVMEEQAGYWLISQTQ
jgi:hypothetical protein